MHTYELRVKLPYGSVQYIRVQSTSRKNAEVAAAQQTGGTVLGGRQVAR